METKAYDQEMMVLALEEARAAFEKGEVPIGAVIALKGEAIARAHNLKEQLFDATAHAEMLVIKAAVEKLGHWRHLREATLYVTLEPCPMCAGAIVQSRLKRLVYGAADPKAGAVGSLMNLVQDDRLNHRVEVVSGVMEAECAALLSDFFRQLRKKEGK